MRRTWLAAVRPPTEWGRFMTLAGRQERALAAAGEITEALAELLRYAREGAHYRTPPFGDVDVAELLADAAKAALEIEQAEHEEQGPEAHPDDAEERNWFLGAIGRFLDGWMP